MEPSKFSMKLIGYRDSAYVNEFYNRGWLDQNVNLSLGIFIVAMVTDFVNKGEGKLDFI